MSKFINLSGMVVKQAADGQDGTRVELCERPAGSTRGVRYVRVLRDGVGISTEQFSGYRAADADKRFAELTQPQPAAPKAKKEKAAKPAAGEEVVYDAGDVRVVKISGKPMVFRTLKAGAVVSEQPCAPQSWRKTQETVVAAAKAL